MTDRAASRPGPEDGSDKDHDGACELYGDAYALVAHGPGMICNRIAAAVRRQCEAAGVEVDERAVERVRIKTLCRYTMVFLILESPARSGSAVVAQRVGEIITGYRHPHVRPNGLSAILAGYPWQRAGVVRVLVWASPDDLEHPALRALRACTITAVDNPDAIGNLFAVYRTMNYDPQQALLDEATYSWTTLREWGVPGLADVPTILAMIHDRVTHYDDPAFPKSRRPLIGVEHNRLSLVLYHPHLRPDQTYRRAHNLPEITSTQYQRIKTNFMESGATVVRKTLQDINQVYRGVERPKDRKKTKDNQVAFKEFYDALVCIAGIPSEIWEKLPTS